MTFQILLDILRSSEQFTREAIDLKKLMNSFKLKIASAPKITFNKKMG